MVDAWRIVKTKYATSAFDGEGASLNGGRWNSVGVPMVYTAESVSLAMLEITVHLDASGLLAAYSLIRVQIDPAHIIQLGPAQLPADWTNPAVATQLRAIGDSWVAGGSSLVLKVPSTVVKQENCYLINPNHPDFHTLKIYSPQPIAFDPRLKLESK